MKALVDATVMQQPATGIANTTLGLYNACLKLVPSLRVQLMHQRPLCVKLPERMRSFQWGRRIPPRLWRSAVIPVIVSASRPTLVHFPWNGNVPQLPPGTWVVTTLHDILPLEIPGYLSDEAKDRYRQEKQRDIGRSNILLTDSEYSKKQILRTFRVRREPVVIYPGCSLQRSECTNDLATLNDKYFLYVGGYDPRKGLIPLLEVFLALRREGRLTGRLVLTGSKSYFSEHLRQLVKEGTNAGFVEEMGYVSSTTLAHLLEAAMALLYPSKYEGFGLPVLEAMTLGCPVMTTQCTSLPEVCGEAVYYIDPDDHRDFAQALIALESDAELRRDLQARGRKQASRFTWDKAASNYLKALSHAMSRESVDA